jgi:hypothetical protein
MFSSKDLFFTTSGGYRVSNSLRFRSSASAYLNRTPASASNRTTYTWSGWVKLCNFGTNLYKILMETVGPTSPGTRTSFLVNQNGDLWFFTDNTATSLLTTTQVLRDFSAWYHIVLAVDTTQATASNRVKMYINGSQVTAFSTSTYPAQNLSTQINNNYLTTIGKSFDNFYADYYLAEVNFIDGQALTPSSFGAYDTDGIWQPIAYIGTYGTNGFELPFSNTTSTTTLVADSSGNGNNWTPNNISLTAGVTYDSMIDSPTNYADGGNGRGNYAVLNPLNNSGGATISDGNLKALWASASDRSVLSTFPIPSTGKFYAEFVVGTLTSASVAVSFGIATAGSSRTGSISANMWVYYGSNQSFIYRNGTGSSQIGSNQTLAAGGILQVAVDRDNNQAWLGYNDVWINSTNGTTGNPSAGTNPTVTSLPADLFILVGMYANNGNVNFGQRPFAYTPPSGFLALNTQNLPTPTIANGASYMAATIWTGDGSANRTLTISSSNSGNNPLGTTFQPDFTWIKARSVSLSHTLYNAIVGGGVNKALSSNTTDSEAGGNADAVNGYLSAFTSTGFSVVNGSSGNYTNVNGRTYVAWQWNAGSGSSSTNTSGSITSTVSANTTAAFSVVTWSGNGGTNATVGHGLGVAPNMIITKNRTGVSDWVVYHSSLSSGYSIFLSTTSAQSNASSWYGSNAPTSSVFYTTYPGNISINASTYTYVSYCFAAVAGYSAFGSYTGNGSTDGPFVYTGFRPRWIMLKPTVGTGSWIILDTSRDPYNVEGNLLWANESTAETASPPRIDGLSNGFKVRAGSGAAPNVSSEVYIYAAFAENPFKISRAR